jgi:hypothetical protein
MFSGPKPLAIAPMTSHWSRLPPRERRPVVVRQTFYRLADALDPKRCPKCDRELTVDDFAVDRGKRGGRKSLCKECDRAKARAYYVANRERVIARVRARKRSG